MPRRYQRKPKTLIGSFIVELTALAGILGLTQPAIREQFWNAFCGRLRVNQNVTAPFVVGKSNDSIQANRNIAGTSKFQSLPTISQPTQSHGAVNFNVVTAQDDRPASLASEVLWRADSLGRY
jgi:hypothetical protein